MREPKPGVPKEIREYMSSKGKKGAKALKDKYGTSHFSRAGKISAEKRKANKKQP